MTLALREAIRQYDAGLEATVDLLEAIETTALRQQLAATDRAFEQFAFESEDRDRLTADLVDLDARLAPVRQLVTTDAGYTDDDPAFAQIRRLRAAAADLVGRILEVDGDSMHMLTEVGVAHRAALADLDQGGHTLAAYRRALAPPSGDTPRFTQLG